MRFYNSENPEDDPVSPQDIFPQLSEQEAICLLQRIGWLPSVTTILSVIRQEYLERWKIKEAIEDFRRNGNIREAIENRYIGNKQSDFGGEVHDLINQWLLSGKCSEGTAWSHALPAIKFFEKETQELIFSEKTLCSKSLRTAGTLDILFKNKQGEIILGDMKVVKFNKKYPINPPINYRAQLSIYGEMLKEIGYTPLKRISIYLSSPFGDITSPSLRVIEYRKCYLDCFFSARTLWEAQYGPDREAIEVYHD